MFLASVFAVHQLSYVLAYGSEAGTELSEHGDHYVVTAAVVAVALAAISLGQVVRASYLLSAADQRARSPGAKPAWAGSANRRAPPAASARM